MLDKPIAKSVAEKGDEVLRLLADGQKVVTLAGHAGTGKTTLIKHLLDQLPGAVVMSYTGQACRMLEKKGIDAKTIHRTIYTPREEPRESIAKLDAQIEEAESQNDHRGCRRLEKERHELLLPEFELNPESPLKNARIGVIDEVSMIGKELGEHVRSFGTPILAVGDDFQLGPVGPKGEDVQFFELAHADVKLEQVFRQRGDSGILDLALDIRGMAELRDQYPDVAFYKKWKMSGDTQVERMHDAGIVIAYRNVTCRRANQRIRRLLDLKGSRYPQGKGEKIICLQNDYQTGVMNGQPIELTDVQDVDDFHFTADLSADGEFIDRVEVYKGYFDMSAETMESEEVKEYRNRPEQRRAREGRLICDWGWAITAHKAQGSEWEHVCILDERKTARWNALNRGGKSPEEAEEAAARWFYTAVTRASDKLVVIEWAT